jgi:UDP-N-acetylmuramoylalanine-D-glutamate ligase
MHEAVIIANSHTPAWKVALLSCASPSMSLWSSYREKGEQYREEVKKLMRK